MATMENVQGRLGREALWLTALFFFLSPFVHLVFRPLRHPVCPPCPSLPLFCFFNVLFVSFSVLCLLCLVFALLSPFILLPSFPFSLLSLLLMLSLVLCPRLSVFIHHFALSLFCLILTRSLFISQPSFSLPPVLNSKPFLRHQCEKNVFVIQVINLVF